MSTFDDFDDFDDLDGFAKEVLRDEKKKKKAEKKQAKADKAAAKLAAIENEKKIEEQYAAAMKLEEAQKAAEEKAKAEKKADPATSAVKPEKQTHPEAGATSTSAKSATIASVKPDTSTKADAVTGTKSDTSTKSDAATGTKSATSTKPATATGAKPATEATGSEATTDTKSVASAKPATLARHATATGEMTATATKAATGANAVKPAKKKTEKKSAYVRPERVDDPIRRAQMDAFFNDKSYYGERDAEEMEDVDFDDDDEESPRKKKKKKSIKGWIVAFVIELLLIAGLGYGIMRTYTHKKYQTVGDVTDIKEADLKVNDGVNPDMLQGYKMIALFGIDARDNSLGKGNRSDAIMICAINQKTKDVKIASVYRDTMMQIETDKGAITAKCNAAYAYGGPELAVQTLNKNLDLNISEYVTVNFEGLSRAIDSLGGIELHLTETEVNAMNKILAGQVADGGLVANPVVMPSDKKEADFILNGVQATAYSRIRSTDQGDITRTERQRTVLVAMLGKARTMDSATLDKFIETMLPYIGTSVTEDEFYEYAHNITRYQLGETTGFPFKYSDYTTKEKGACLVAQNLNQNVTALQRYFFGTLGYEPTANVKAISQTITTETGIDDAGPINLPGEGHNLKPVGTEGDADSQ